MEWVIFWLIIMPTIVAIIANSKGRSPFLWFLYAFFIWPIALVHVLVVGRPIQEKPLLNVAEEIAKLKALRDQNVITHAEFERQKAALLQRPS